MGTSQPNPVNGDLKPRFNPTALPSLLRSLLAKREAIASLEAQAKEIAGFIQREQQECKQLATAIAEATGVVTPSDKRDETTRSGATFLYSTARGHFNVHVMRYTTWDDVVFVPVDAVQDEPFPADNDPDGDHAAEDLKHSQEAV